MAPEGTVPASWRVTDWPAGSEARVQVSVAAVKVTPAGRFGLEMLVKPWAGQGVDHAQVGGVQGPVLETTTRVGVGGAGHDRA